MFWSLLMRTTLPFGLPILLILFIIFMARSRFTFLQKVPVWVWPVLILLLLMTWGLVLYLRWRKEKQDAEAIEDGIMVAQGSGADLAPARRAELEQLQTSLKESIAQLKAGPQGKKALYTIPWYMIIGPPAIGKTTAILNAGLNFPNMTTAKRLRGSGGTRNCDWWFSTDAILLDTAGRYAQSADRSETEEEWFGFLDLLKRHRKKNPINGLILGYSAETLIEASEDKLINDARELRQRIDEIMTRSGFTFPVYLLFTKCDLISGFVDFFNSFSPIERQQVWGATFPVPNPADSSPADTFMAEFDHLVEKVREIRAKRLATAGRNEAWGRIFMFPEEMAALRRRLHLFMETLFERNPFSVDQPLFRGAYFSSGKQMGTPFETVVGKIQAILGGGSRASFAEEQAEKDEAYFVRDLFTKLFKSDQELSRQTAAGSKRGLRIKLGLSIACGVLALIACTVIVSSYFRLNTRMNDTKTAIAEFDKQSEELAPDAETLGILHQLRSRVAGSWRAFPLTVADNVRTAANDLYLAALRKRVLTPIESDLADQLQYPDDLDGDQIRRSLRSELLLLYPERKGEIGDAQELADALFLFGIQDADDNPQARGQFEDMAKDFLDQGQPLRSPDDRGVPLSNGARGLRYTHTADAFFQGIVAGASRELDDFTLERVGNQSMFESSGKISAAFTQTGWNEYVSDRIKNVSKVIEEDNKLITLAGERPAEGAPSKDDMIGLYAETYPLEWSNFLESIEMRTYDNCGDATDDFKTLKSNKSSPILKLMKSLARESDFGLRNKELEGVSKSLEPVRNFMEAPEEGERAPINDYRETLSDIEDQLAQCDEDSGFSYDSGIFRKAGNNIDDYLDSFDGDELTDAMKKLLNRPIDRALQILKKEKQVTTISSTSAQWKDQVYGDFKSGLAGKYPFRGGGSPATVGAIVDILKSGGGLDSFQEYLDGTGLAAGSQTKKAFRSAERIRSSLGVNGGNLAASFRIELLAPRALGTAGDANLRVMDLITLVVNGNRLTRRSSNRSMNATWSSDSENNSCSLSLEHTSANKKLGEMEKEGSLWSWFQLLDQASQISQDGSDYLITWEFPDSEIAIDCRLTMHDGGECPFVRGSTFRKFTLGENPLK